MKVKCPSCLIAYELSESLGGRPMRCGRCSHISILQIPDPDSLLKWASSAPWNRLDRFICFGGALGHSRDTIDKFSEVELQRRTEEEWRIRRENSKSPDDLLPVRDRIWRRVEIQARNDRLLTRIRGLDWDRFLELVVRAFHRQGFQVQNLEPETGVDLFVSREGEDSKFVVLCYQGEAALPVKYVRDIISARNTLGTPHARILSTEAPSRVSRELARNHPWLTVQYGVDLLRFLFHRSKGVAKP